MEKLNRERPPSHRQKWVSSFGHGALHHPSYQKYYHSYVRDSLVQLLDLCHHKDDSSILSMGCGTGIELAVLRELGFTDLRGWELLPEMRALSPVPDLIDIRDMCQSQEPEREYDLIFITGVLHHIENPDAFSTIFQNAYKHLKTGGYLLIREPRPCLLTQAALHASSNRLLTRILLTLARCPFTREFAEVKLIQQQILFLERPAISLWFKHFQDILQNTLPSFFSVRQKNTMTNIFLAGQKRE